MYLNTRLVGVGGRIMYCMCGGLCWGTGLNDVFKCPVGWGLDDAFTCTVGWGWGVG